jgi:hypothetical protein
MGPHGEPLSFKISAMSEQRDPFCSNVHVAFSLLDSSWEGADRCLLMGSTL